MNVNGFDIYVLICSFLFTVDIILNFNVGVYIEGLIITERKEIAYHYL